MSTRGRGRGRGRGKKEDSPDMSFSPSDMTETNPPTAVSPVNPVQPKRRSVKTIDDYKRTMDIIKSRISVIIDSLEGNENDVSLKRNVATAVKHLKQIDDLLEC